ncbi:ABC transporter ATP-binding protein [Thermovenabulum gondwanense]|uniref:Lipopolysaccharide export system ATP-binding protein LptB n=1 Tax=Thermovenabulum gondwanense TaxID=520767 RepID=A0A161QCP6_9FIRM|nr:ABC transporter ATP-binding protein [Thermovenabulum gondwanense]KYO67058.1 Lipopolysaccharide export system ATP-binding protein LptB [Thermovenabulum gondwanense]
MYLLELDNISKSFGGIRAVSDLSFYLKKGEIVGLIGPNGAGKTTVFNLITGVYGIDSGKIKFKGEYIHNYNPVKIVNRGIARTFQNIRLFNRLSVLDNVRTVLYKKADYNLFHAILGISKVKKEEEKLKEMAYSYLEDVGLTVYANFQASGLPYGFQRKLEIARALALSPELLLLDEPAAGMNPEESLELVELINKLKNKYNLSIILIEHHMDVVMNLCPRIIVMNFGSKLMEGTKDEVQNDPRVIKAYLGEEDEEC